MAQILHFLPLHLQVGAQAALVQVELTHTQRLLVVLVAEGRVLQMLAVQQAHLVKAMQVARVVIEPLEVEVALLPQALLDQGNLAVTAVRVQLLLLLEHL